MLDERLTREPSESASLRLRYVGMLNREPTHMPFVDQAFGERPLGEVSVRSFYLYSSTLSRPQRVQVQFLIFIRENARGRSVKVHLDAKIRFGRSAAP